ncbi:MULTISPECIES: hypothetical protein [unclassified Myxococcus]|jgi:hypothetical protein|uniref:hypothetical protein n=1 Tax=Myxococcus TaxID=32 RepID=UPI001CBA8A63|nr:MULTISPECIES: hypothetical protein [unclassified Myxococcus]MBZ4399491.1 hypothetical protein [Myxococcus sp. AS-1-15]MBZ4412228.1 hypothetical protein [Myxococcus sp. XM-1-1-1]BDT34281.1 hypothetical protein MFMH1_39500 [Myxococcus sp. MH1]
MATWNDLILATPRQVNGRHQEEGPVALQEALLGTEGEQLVLLGHLHREPHLLREGAFHAGRAHLEASTRPSCTRDERLEQIRAAGHRFTEALGAERDTARVSLISLHLGLCRLLLGSPKDAREWLGMANQSAVETLKDILTEATGEQGFTRNRLLGGMLNFVMFFTSSATLGAGYLVWDRVMSKRSDKVLRRALARMEPLAGYIDALREMRLRLGEPASSVPRYVVTHTVDDSQCLSRITIRTLVGEGEAVDFNGRETRRVSRTGSERTTPLIR